MYGTEVTMLSLMGHRAWRSGATSPVARSVPMALASSAGSPMEPLNIAL